jgi:hypothetical protein
MNNADSWGFNLEAMEIDWEIARAERCVLIAIPGRDLREWVIRHRGDIVGYVDQEGGGRFKALDIDAAVIADFSNLEHAVRSVELADLIRRNSSGICCGMFQ